MAMEPVVLSHGPFNIQMFGTAAPSLSTDGTYKVGDIVWNTAPTAGGTLMWVCTTAGTPGTWKTVAVGA